MLIQQALFVEGRKEKVRELKNIIKEANQRLENPVWKLDPIFQKIIIENENNSLVASDKIESDMLESIGMSLNFSD